MYILQVTLFEHGKAKREASINIPDFADALVAFESGEHVIMGIGRVLQEHGKTAKSPKKG